MTSSLGLDIQGKVAKMDKKSHWGDIECISASGVASPKEQNYSQGPLRMI